MKKYLCEKISVVAIYKNNTSNNIKYFMSKVKVNHFLTESF